MSFGLRVWDQSQKLTLDTTRGIPKLLGRIVVTQAGSLNDARFLQGQPWVISRPSNTQFVQSPCRATVSGQTLSWEAGSGPTVLFYGVN